MRFQASQFSTSTSLHHVSKIVSKCIKIVSTDVRKYKIFSGEIPRTPLSRGGNAPSRALPLLVPSALVNVFNLSWPDHFSKADDGPGLPYQVVAAPTLNTFKNRPKNSSASSLRAFSKNCQNIVKNSRAKSQNPSVEKHAHPPRVVYALCITNTYSIHKVSSLKFAYFQGRLSRHITSLFEKTRPESWPGGYMW